MLTLTAILLIGALIGAIASAYGKAPLWVAVLLVALAALIGIVPIK